ncbi:MAG: TolC family protein [Planctomycetota bacterium]|nr:MAG: TolC family protein [Planctomycetota bacterium]
MPLWSKEPPKKALPATSTWKLSLKQAILLALKNNLDIQIEAYNPRILNTEVDRALAGASGGLVPFDPLLKASFQFTSLRTPTFVDTGAQFLGIPGSIGEVKPDKTKTIQFSLSLEQRFSTGTTYTLSYTHGYRKTDRVFGLNPSYSSSLSLTLTQPLLKGLGPFINTVEIKIAQNSLSQSQVSFRLKVIQVIQDVISKYWDLVQAYQNLKLKEKSYQVAKELLEIAKLKLKIGTAPSLEVASARAGLASRHADLINGYSQWKNSSDQLLALLLPPEEFRTFREIVEPSDLPGDRKEKIVLDQEILEALKYRLEIQLNQLELQNKKILLAQSEHNLLPSLNLSGTVTLNGLGGELDDSYRFIRPKKFHDFQVALNFTYPLFQRAEKSAYEKALLEKEQTMLKILSTKRDIFLQVRQAYRNLLSSKEAYLARVEASRFAKEKLDGERTRYSVGKSTNHQVLQVEEEYTQARTQEIEAKISIVKAYLALDVATGKLLHRYGIEIRSQRTLRE